MSELNELNAADKLELFMVPTLRFSDLENYIYIDTPDYINIVLALNINLKKTQLCTNFDIDRNQVGIKDLPFITKRQPVQTWFDMCLNRESKTIKYIKIHKFVQPKLINKALKTSKNHLNEYFDIIQTADTPSRFSLKRLNFIIKR